MKTAVESKALLEFLYESDLKPIFRTKEKFLNYLFTKDVCTQNKCSSPSEYGKEMSGLKDHFFKHVMINEHLIKKYLLEQKYYNAYMTSELLGSIVKHIGQYFNDFTECSLSFKEGEFKSDSQSSVKLVCFLNKFYCLSQNSSDIGLIADFWYIILYIHYTGNIKMSLLDGVHNDVAIKLDILGIDANLLDDYIKNVILNAGVSGLAGMRSIIRFANQSEKKSNPFALFEAGEIYYYDRLESGVPDFNKAHEYYLKAAKFNFPLALWSLGYMYQRYGKKDSITGKMINFSIDPELENDELKRYEKALEYFKKACEGECGAAYNSIGNYYTLKYSLLRRLWNKLYPFNKINEGEVISITDTNTLECQEYYYRKSAELKDANGTFNYYRLIVKKVIKEKDLKTLNKKKLDDYREKILNYLEYLVELEYPAGCNSLALHLIHVTELDEMGIHLWEKENYPKARELFKLAADKKGVEHFPWAQFNYAFYFLKERDRNFDKAIEYFDRGTETGDDLCYIKCCKEIFSCLILRNLSNSDVDGFLEKYSGHITEIIEKQKKADERNLSIWTNLEHLGKSMSLCPKPNGWILNYMEVKSEKKSEF